MIVGGIRKTLLICLDLGTRHIVYHEVKLSSSERNICERACSFQLFFGHSKRRFSLVLEKKRQKEMRRGGWYPPSSSLSACKDEKEGGNEKDFFFSFFCEQSSSGFFFFWRRQFTPGCILWRKGLFFAPDIAVFEWEKGPFLVDFYYKKTAGNKHFYCERDMYNKYCFLDLIRRCVFPILSCWCRQPTCDCVILMLLSLRKLSFFCCSGWGTVCTWQWGGGGKEYNSPHHYGKKVCKIISETPHSTFCEKPKL